MQGIIRYAILTSAAFRAAVLSIGFYAVAAELADPIVVRAALVAVLAIVITAANILVACFTFRAVGLAVKGAINAESAHRAEQILVFSKTAIAATRTDKLAMAIGASVRVAVVVLILAAGF